MNIQRFLYPRLIATIDGRDERVGGGLGLPVKIVKRSELAFERSRLVGPPSKAKSAIAFQAAHNADAADPGVHIVVDADSGSEASVWTWDRRDHQRDADNLLERRQLPETLAYEQLADGARVVACIEGYEGQVWRASALVESRWWPSPPDERDWLAFLRHAKEPLTDENIAARAPVEPMFKAFVAPIGNDRDSIARILTPTFLGVLIGAAFLVFAAVSSVQAIGHGFIASALDASAEKTAAANQDAIIERRKAMRISKRTESLAAAAPQNSASQILTAVLNVAPSEQVQFSNIRIGDGEFEVRFIQQADVDHAELLRRMEQSPLLERVRVTSSVRGGDLIIAGDTSPITPVAFSANAGTGVGAR